VTMMVMMIVMMMFIVMFVMMIVCHDYLVFCCFTLQR